MKRAQGISMTTIVIAALALLVLVVLVLIFTGRMNLFSTGMKENVACGAYCKSIAFPYAKSAAEGACGSQDKWISGIPGPNDKEGECCCTKTAPGG